MELPNISRRGVFFLAVRRDLASDFWHCVRRTASYAGPTVTGTSRRGGIFRGRASGKANRPMMRVGASGPSCAFSPPAPAAPAPAGSLHRLPRSREGRTPPGQSAPCRRRLPRRSCRSRRHQARARHRRARAGGCGFRSRRPDTRAARHGSSRAAGHWERGWRSRSDPRRRQRRGNGRGHLRHRCRRPMARTRGCSTTSTSSRDRRGSD